jgi:hypothetical protein
MTTTTPIPELQPDVRRRLDRLFKAVLPPSYYFKSAYRRMVHDLEQSLFAIQQRERQSASAA